MAPEKHIVCIAKAICHSVWLSLVSIPMKHYIQCLLWLIAIGCYGNDTLTRAQVYNFDIGDTLDYKISFYTNDVHTDHADYYWFERKVVDSVYYNLTIDTLNITLRKVPQNTIEKLQIADLDSAQYKLFVEDTGCSATLLIGSLSVFNGRTYNEVELNCLFEHAHSYSVAAGLGEIYDKRGVGNTFDGFTQTDSQLIYYSKTGETGGSPFTIENGGETIQYIPLPEDCAIWTSVRNATPSQQALYEQIKTGLRIHVNGHAYVEMLYSYFDLQTGNSTQDSLLGYFRNDTLGRKALFATLPGLNDSVFYDFTLINGTKMGVDHITLDTLIVGGAPRTKWKYTYYDFDPNHYGFNTSYVAGMGSMNGLINVHGLIYAGTHPTELTCFSVCGNTLYPSSVIGNCNKISAVKEIAHQSAFLISPTIVTERLFVYTDSALPYSYSIHNTAGQMLSGGKMAGAIESIDITHLSAGLYLINILDSDNHIHVARFVVP